jgi:hypothetical protein
MGWACFWSNTPAVVPRSSENGGASRSFANLIRASICGGAFQCELLSKTGCTRLTR